MKNLSMLHMWQLQRIKKCVIFNDCGFKHWAIIGCEFGGMVLAEMVSLYMILFNILQHISNEVTANCWPEGHNEISEIIPVQYYKQQILPSLKLQHQHVTEMTSKIEKKNKNLWICLWISIYLGVLKSLTPACEYDLDFGIILPCHHFSSR